MSRPLVQILSGARAAEAALLAQVDLLLPPGGTDLELLARPVRIIVPSRSLRLHVAAALVRHRGGALAGVVVQTLAAVSAQVQADLGLRAGHADPALDVLVRRQAAAESALTQVLGGLDDGLGTAVRPVAELLDAGFDAGRDAIPLATMLRDLPDSVAGPDERLRALALVAVAGRVQADLRSLGLSRHAEGHRAAAAALRRDAAGLLPSRAVLIHGLTDPSGPELELVEALQAAGAQVLLAAPAPVHQLATERALAAPQEPAAAPLVERLAQGGRVVVSPQGHAPPDIVLAACPGRQAEARHAARQVQALLAQGVEPERIGIVVRDLASWAGRLRPELDRLGLPWSGVGGQAPPGPALRRLQALGELLARQADAAADRWLDAAWRLPGTGRVPTQDLRTALRAMGRARLRDVATVDLDALLGGAAYLSLPVRTGVVALQDDAPGGGGPDGLAPGAAARRRVPRAALEATVAAAQDLVLRLQAGRSGPLSVHATALRELASHCLGWADPEAAWRALGAALVGLVGRLGPDLVLDTDEARLLVGPALLGAAAGPIGGQGGGVQVLSAVEARGRTFEHLFVLGLSRGELPRSPRPDPLLTDALRGRLRSLLPDLPTTRDRLAAERALLSHLLSSAPQVALSWPASDDDGRRLPASPLVERLRLALPTHPVLAIPVPGSRLDPLPALATLPRPAGEHARYRALYGPDDADAVDSLAAALSPTPELSAGLLRTAQARVELRQELDAAPGTRPPGPFLGFVGPVGSGADPRAGDPYVTTVEQVAACGWQAFLSKVLRVESPPDRQGSLPGIDARLVGTVVHRVLEDLCRAALATRPEGATEPAVMVPWPAADALAVQLETVARAVALDEGLALPGLWRALARRSAPFLEVARAQDWDLDGPAVVAVEAEGVATVQTPGGPRQVRFRADRVDRDARGQLVLTDYKTGKPLSTKRKAMGRDQDLLAAVARGARMQVGLYARTGGTQAVGRYLSLRPDVLDAEDPARVARIPGEELEREPFDQALDHAAGVALMAWETGALLPRLVDARGDSGAACAWCELQSACLQGDSSARLRQLGWAQQAGAAASAQTPAPMGQALALWWLGQAPADDVPPQEQP